MGIVGHGIDLVETARIAELIDRHGERFLERVFTSGEREGAGRGPSRVEHLAARFAAKEAVAKALGTGIAGGVHWTDIEVEIRPGGQPSIRLHGGAARAAESRGARGWHLSLTHTRTHAMASAIATDGG
jgi:holo-[acyl-carrier protein] synthase